MPSAGRGVPANPHLASSAVNQTVKPCGDAIGPFLLDNVDGSIDRRAARVAEWRRNDS
jgi:hypothetical protein